MRVFKNKEYYLMTRIRENYTINNKVFYYFDIILLIIMINFHFSPSPLIDRILKLMLCIIYYVYVSHDYSIDR